MADADENAQGVFRSSTMNRVASSEELDHYIKVTNPSAWIVTIAALLLVAGVLIWAIVAIVPITIETTGFLLIEENSEDTRVVCIVNQATANRIKGTGAKAFVDGVEAESVEMENTPLSASEVVSLLGSDFYADSIEIGDWNYLIIIKPSQEPSHTSFEIKGNYFQAHLVPASIIVYETQPINIILGNKG